MQGLIGGNEFEANVDEGFGFGAWNEHRWGDFERTTIEFAMTNQVRDGFAFGTSCNEFAHGGTLSVAEGGVEVCVEANTRTIAGVGKQEFGFQSRGFDAFLAEKACCPFENALDGPYVGICGSGGGCSGGD